MVRYPFRIRYFFISKIFSLYMKNYISIICIINLYFNENQRLKYYNEA